MTENKYLHFQGDNNFSLKNIKDSLKKEDFVNNLKLQKIFNLFDSDGNGSIDICNTQGKNEVQNLWNTIQHYSLKNGNSIFDNEEAQSLINESQVNINTPDSEKISVNDVFNFLKSIINKNTTQNSEEILNQSYTPDEIKEFSIQTFINNAQKARQIFNSQNENQGAVSDFVSDTKEIFDTEYAPSRVNRFLMGEELCADLLTKSKSEEGLSKKEYLEAKIDLVVNMLPKLKDTAIKSKIVKHTLSQGLYGTFGNKTKAEQEIILLEKETELLKDALRKLTPENLTLFIQRIISISDAEYDEKAAEIVENMVNSSLQERINDNQKSMTDSNKAIIKRQPISGSIEDIEQQNDIYEKMTFEETFEAERGVQYNTENTMNYIEKDAKMQFLLGMHNKRQQIYNILHDATVNVDGNNKLGAPDIRAIKPCEEQLETAIIQALRNLYGDDIEKLQAGLDKLGFSNLKYSSGKLFFDYGEESGQDSPFKMNHECNGYDLVNIANKLQDFVDTNYEKALGGKSLEEYGQEVNNVYKMAYGARNAQNMAEAFVESQQEGVQTVKSTIQTGAMVVMVAGQIIPVGGQVASAMIMGGLAMSTVGGVGVSALENYTKAGGPTEKDKQEMLQELGISLALVSSGMGIGKTSEAVFRALVIKNCPKLLAFACEVGIDATMSLVADYAITGQIDLSGEGIVQLQAILVGVLHAKGNFKSYMNTHAGDLTNPINVTSKPKIETVDEFKKIPETSKADTKKSDNAPNPNPQGAWEQSEVNVENLGKKAYVKPEVSAIEDVLPADIAQYLKSVAKNKVLKKAGITLDVADKMRIETSGTYDSLLPSTLQMIEHFENKLAKGEKITPDDIYKAIQEFDSYWAQPGYGSKFQTQQRDLISKYWKNADKDFADKFNVAMKRTPEVMELRETVAKNAALKNGGITPDIATQMLRETSGTYGVLLPRTLDMISYMQAKIEGGAKLSSILVNEAFNKFNKEYTQAGYGSKFQNLQRDLISKYWKNAGENFGKIYDVAKNLDIDTPVQEIRAEYKNAFDTIDKNVRAMGLDKIGKMSIRLKSEQSLHDKIANYLIDHPGATVADAVKDVRDAIGARTVVESGEFANHPEVKVLLDAGKEREAMLRAAELQSEPAVESFKAEILKQEQNKNNFAIARISNYVSPNGIPYLSENQLADLKQFAANHGVKLKINLRIDPSDPNFSKVDENYKPTTKSQPSGYTALQANFTTKDGKKIEWQFRGDKVNEFAEGEHIPYDLRTGKNIIGEHKELEALYNPFIEMLSKENMKKETYKEYNRYLGDYYTHLRKLELGFDSVEPKLEDYGNGFKFDERLSAKNLIALHETAEKIKKKTLSVKDAMAEYNQRIKQN